MRTKIEFMQHRVVKSALVCLAVAVLASTTAWAQPAPNSPLPMPAYGATGDIAGAANRPDPALIYKVVFDVTASSGTREKNQTLVGVARFVNTLAQHGVPMNHRNIAVVIHGPATTLIMRDADFKTRTGAAANPNTQLVKDLTAAGVEIHVCGHAAQGMNISPEMQMSEVIRDLSAGMSLINFQTRGYVKVGG